MEIFSPKGRITRVPWAPPPRDPGEGEAGDHGWEARRGWSADVDDARANAQDADAPQWAREAAPERYDPDDDPIEVGDVETGEARHDFADWLVKTNRVSAQVARMALMEQKVTNVLLGTILVRNNFMRAQDLTRAILEFRPECISNERVAASRIPVEVLRDKKIVISAVTADTMHVSSMLDEDEISPILSMYYPDKKVRFVAFPPDQLDEFLDSISSGSTDLRGLDSDPESMLTRMLHLAIESGASDIHIEPRPDTYVIFMRRLGVREAVYEGAREEYTSILTRIKERARMDIAQSRKPQDGSFPVAFGNRSIDMRVGTTIGVAGEKAVLRVLDQERVDPKLDTLGITNIKEWRHAANHSSGIALICGVTGSGKSTTMDATAKEQDRFGKAIYTIEDPVEFSKAYVTSINLNADQGQDFANILKHLMRADPDNIQIGEIRDKEVARQAITAADTGHMILATMHTDSIASVPSRLMRLGIDPHEIRMLLRGVLVQKLVRTVCTTCEGHGSINGSPCPNKVCSGSGYGGLTVVSECVSFARQEDVDDLLGMMSIEGKKAEEMPWRKIIDDAIDKMLAGITTLDELERVFGSDLDRKLRERGIDGREYRLPRGQTLHRETSGHAGHDQAGHDSALVVQVEAGTVDATNVTDFATGRPLGSA